MKSSSLLTVCAEDRTIHAKIKAKIFVTSVPPLSNIASYLHSSQTEESYSNPHQVLINEVLHQIITCCWISTRRTHRTCGPRDGTITRTGCSCIAACITTAMKLYKIRNLLCFRKVPNFQNQSKFAILGRLDHKAHSTSSRRNQAHENGRSSQRRQDQFQPKLKPKQTQSTAC